MGDKTLTLREAVPAKDANVRVQEIKAFADIAANAVCLGNGGLVDSLHHAGGTFVAVTINLIVMSTAVIKAYIGKDGANGTTVSQACVGTVVLGLGELVYVAALESAVVRHNVAAIDAARITHGLGVVGTGIEPEVAGNNPVHGERGEEKQVGVAVLILPYLVIEGLGVEFEGQAEGDVEVGRLVLVGLREGEAVGVVPKVVAEGKPLLTAAASDSVVASGVNIGKNIREAHLGWWWSTPLCHRWW